MKRDILKGTIKIAAIFAAVLILANVANFEGIYAQLRELCKNSQSPTIFLCLMGFATPFGFPLSACYIIAGMCFGLNLGFGLCVAGLFLSSTLGYFLGKFAISQKFYDTLRLKLKISDLTKRGKFNVNFLIRAIPGVPYWLQNIVLARLSNSYLLYEIVNLVTQSTIAFAMVFFSSSLGEEGLKKYAAIALMIFILAAIQIAGNLFFKYHNAKKVKYSDE